jgi:hypothetical protein
VHQRNKLAARSTHLFACFRFMTFASFSVSCAGLLNEPARRVFNMAHGGCKPLRPRLTCNLILSAVVRVELPRCHHA